ncbi:putative hemolysin [Inhella inkyongensis]|uniref:L-ornithine N(alpha)-acyltransferase n=1 Tax=Inhella inkyongensis TaxID=392593 RepID=A0A840S026_9BURK|nr:GNAT family N-acyltransferase [Inhella inkyongensis]MBB5203153.1 putative hemolysin [Inhella inkyongensis]
MLALNTTALPHPLPHSLPIRSAPGPVSLHWARHQDEVREAQRLRHQVFAQELGAQLRPLAGAPAGHDVDVFDAHCEHLLAREQNPDGSPGAVVACYRLLSPSAAQRVGGLYAETEFDLTRLRHERHRIAELGRACIAPSHRNGAALLMMWGAIAAYLQREGLDLMLGCASVDARDGGSTAWQLWNQLVPQHLAPIEFQVRPRTPLHPAPARLQPVEAPPLLRGYLKANAKLLGAPAWDGDFRCADFPLMVQLDALPAAYLRRFSLRPHQA